jgi:hypothetical protein
MLVCVMPLSDGEYDVVVTDAVRDDDGVVTIELAIASGEHRGDVIRLSSAMTRDPIDWLGLPGTLKVVDGVPAFRLD